MKEAIFRLKKAPIRCKSITSLNYGRFFSDASSKAEKVQMF